MLRTLFFSIALVLLSCVARATDNKNPKPYQLHAGIIPSELKVEGPGRFELTITPEAPYLLKVETPFKVVLSASDGLQLAKTELTAKDFVDQKTPAKTVVGELVAKKKGEQQLTAELTFFLCTDEICQRFTDRVTTTVKVGA
jgi:hypothetical protein